MLFHEGDVANSFYCVLRGEAKIFRLTPAGNETILHIVREGELAAQHGTVPDTLLRSFRQLKNLDLIEDKEGGILLLDQKKLLALCQ